MEDRAAQIRQLIDSARRQDAEALGSLLGLFRNYLTVLAQMRVEAGWQAQVDRSDVVQETLAKAHQRFDKFRGSTEPEFAAWLRQVLTRQIIDTSRRLKSGKRDATREKAFELLVDGSSLAMRELAQTRFAAPSKQARDRELAVALSDALARLPDDQREVIICKNIQGLSWSATAERMGNSIGAVRELWIKALKALRPLILEHQ